MRHPFLVVNDDFGPVQDVAEVVGDQDSLLKALRRAYGEDVRALEEGRRKGRTVV